MKENKDSLASITQFGKNHRLYPKLDKLCFLSKNLYNTTLYQMRQSIYAKDYKNYNYWQRVFQDENQPDYRALPAKVAQQTMMLADNALKSFFGSVSSENLSAAPKLPKYKDKKTGRQVVIYTNQAISFKEKGYIRLSGTDIMIKTDLPRDLIKEVRVVPKPNHIAVEIVYNVDEVPIKEDNGRYASID